MKDNLILKMKRRDSFRAFAPSILREAVPEWFEQDGEAFMMQVFQIRAAQRARIPAVTHVDYSARVQTVRADSNPRFHALLSAFHALTGCPTLVNTSFNVRGEPVVGSPEDAFRCFMGTHLDRLAVGNCYLLKSEQPAALAREYAHLLPAD